MVTRPRPRRLLGRYRLEGKEPVYIDDMMEWARWYEHAGDACIVARTEVGHATVSTVFLSIDHNWTGKGPPILFETMIFLGEGDSREATDYCTRYATWAEAEAGHARAVTMVKEASAVEVKT